MGKSDGKGKFLKSVTVFALSTSFVFAPLGQAVNVTKASSYKKAEEILANLTAEQRAALNQLTINEETGIRISSEIDLNSSSETSVIVEFTHKPAKVAQMEAGVKGETLTEAEASKLVEQDHETFAKEASLLLVDEKSRKANYRIDHSYKHAFNGVSMSLPANQIKNLLKSKAVKTVWSNEKFELDLPALDDYKALKSDQFNMANYTPYDGLDRLHSEGLTGKGIKIGVLDTGIDHQHPDLKDAYKGGYDFVDNDHDPMEATYSDWKNSGKPEFSGSNAYYTEHGTHVAGIIGGRGVSNSEYTTLGAAPEADIFAYRVLGPYGGGTTDDIIAGIDQALQDGMDIMNLSLGAQLNDPFYATSIAVNQAVLSGVTMVVAAGNSGDKMYTLGSPGASALALTVGASSVSIDLYQYAGVQNGKNYQVRQLARNYFDDLASLKGKTYQLVDVGLGTPAHFSGKDLTGKMAFIKRGSIGLADKIKNAKANGAAGVLMYNDEANQAEGPIQAYLGESMDAVPAFSVSYDEGLEIVAAIKAGDTEFTFGDFEKVQSVADELAGFSSRGPSRVNYDIKPEVTAPGVSILSTVPFYINNKTADGSKPEDYQYAYSRLSGTSMATPYVAGVAALLLQSNQDLEPADVKTILMNTADPLSKEYSVFEAGSGRVDAYEAVHSDVQIQVVDKTPMLMNGKEKSITELTGGISFGTFGFDGENILDSRTIQFENHGKKTKTFRVEVKFQTGVRESKDAVRNNVTLDGPTSVKLNGNSKQSLKYTLNIPKTAEKGTYEGYIVLTNDDDPYEQYQIPFGGRVVDEGIDSLKVVNPLFSTDTAWPAIARPFLSYSFTLKSHMKTLDVVLHDPTTGKDLGLVGTFNPLLLDENKENSITKGFNAIYYPFTDDAKNPISRKPVMAKTGHYQLKLIGTNERGKSFTAASDFIYELGAPTMTSSFDSLDQKVIEYNENQFDSKGQFLYDFNINMNDPEVEEAKALGIPVDQSSNSIVSFYKSSLPSSPVNTDKDGNFRDQILVKKQAEPLQVQFYGFDAANNFTANATNMLRVAFVDDQLPYYYVKVNKQTAFTGDTVNYTVRANNIKNLKKTTMTILVSTNYAVVENAVINEAVKQYGDAQVEVTSAPSGFYTAYTFTFTYSGHQTLPEDLPLFNFDLRTLEKFPIENPFRWDGNQIKTSTIDQSNVETANVYTYMEVFKQKSKVSRVDGALQVEGAKNPSTGATNSAIDQSKIGAKVTVTSPDGNSVVDAPITSKSGNYTVDSLIADQNNAYTVTIDVPGHFTINQEVILANIVRGETIGKLFRYNLQLAAAGDTNKDNVIDILDAVALQENWGTNNPKADFNFDQAVNEKDMYYIIKNYGMQNPTAEKAPKAKDKYKGKTLDTILSELGMN